MHTCVYSFRTNKHREAFECAGISVFVFGKLKEDLLAFAKHIRDTKPTHIIGLAEVKTSTRWESRAVNVFGKSGKVSKGGVDVHRLYVPAKTPFPATRNTTHTFCNWTAYKLSEMIQDRNTTISFLHYNYSDFESVVQLLGSKFSNELCSCSKGGNW